MTDEDPEVNVPWSNTADDGRFDCRVVQENRGVVFTDPERGVVFDDADTKGRLVVTVTRTGDRILDEEVDIRAGAIFGPDMEDVERWQDMCIEAIDAWIAAND